MGRVARARKVAISASEPAAQPQKIAVLDGKLHIYLRPNSKFWQCGFHHNGVYVRTSTKSPKLDEATELAKHWFYGKQAELKLGAPVAPTKTTFSHFADLAVADYERLARESKGSADYAKGLKLIIENNLKPFFGRYPLKSINQQLWHRYQTEHLDGKGLSTGTVKQHLNGVRVVFRRARMRGESDATPTFTTERKAASEATSRTWFEPDQYQKLFRALRKNIKAHQETRWKADAEELHDYVLFVANCGLRVDEAKSLRFCDVEIVQDDTAKDALGEPLSYLILRNLLGKRGRGTCKTYFGAAWPFERIIERRGLKGVWQDSQATVFLRYHRDMFNAVLNGCGLKHTNDVPPRRRDLMSLRNTYICYRLLDGANIWDVANNCRTSVTVIENHYARWLSPLMSNINKAPLKSYGQERSLNVEDDDEPTD